MDKNKTCYLFFDFDGTVTADVITSLPGGIEKKERILPESHLRSIKAAHDLGHKIFLCTGRSKGSMFKINGDWLPALSLPWDGMLFGASDMWHLGKRIAVTYISKEECLFWINYCKETNRVFCYNGTEAPIRYDFSKHLSKEELNDIYADLEMQLLENPITNLSAIPAATDIDRSKTSLTIVHLPTYTDAFPADCNKGSAIVRYCKLIGAPIEQTVCFGDSENDMDMFKVCSISVAMKKAPDSLKSIATYSAKTDFGVTEAISQFFEINKI